MVLNSKPGWLIDYATARAIFNDLNPQPSISVAGLCAAGILKYCACEKKSFVGNGLLKGPFHQDQNCACNLTHEIVEIAKVLPNSIGRKKINPSDSGAKMIVACAIKNNFGIISSKSGLFITPIDLAGIHGVAHLTLDDFYNTI